MAKRGKFRLTEPERAWNGLIPFWWSALYRGGLPHSELKSASHSTRHFLRLEVVTDSGRAIPDFLGSCGRQ